MQTDLEFKENRIYEINSKYNVDMFSTAVSGGKAFAGEQKIMELKKRIFRLKTSEKK